MSIVLDALARTGPAASSTQPASAVWAPPPGWRAIERSAVVGAATDWPRLRDAVLHWVVKRRAGFAIPLGRATAGERLLVTARVGPAVVREPIEVVEVVDEPARAGFAYATLAGHPVAGEEAFVVHLHADAVVLTVRSLTRAAPSRAGGGAAPLPARAALSPRDAEMRWERDGRWNASPPPRSRRICVEGTAPRHPHVLGRAGHAVTLCGSPRAILPRRSARRHDRPIRLARPHPAAVPYDGSRCRKAALGM